MNEYREEVERLKIGRHLRLTGIITMVLLVIAAMCKSLIILAIAGVPIFFIIIITIGHAFADIEEEIGEDIKDISLDEFLKKGDGLLRKHKPTWRKAYRSSAIYNPAYSDMPGNIYHQDKK